MVKYHPGRWVVCAMGSLVRSSTRSSQSWWRGIFQRPAGIPPYWWWLWREKALIHQIVSSRSTHGITVEVPGLRNAYALPVPKQRSVFSYQLVLICFEQWQMLKTNVPGDPQQSRVDKMGRHPQHKRLPSQRCLCRQHDNTHPRHSQVIPWMWNDNQGLIALS